MTNLEQCDIIDSKDDERRIYMFVGRKTELKKLDGLYNTDKFQLAVIYGRRRVGKTALINEFSSDKKTVSFTGLESTPTQNLENLSLAIHTCIGSDGPAPIYPSFQSALEAVFAAAKDRRLIFVMDEYPYLARSYPAISSILQALIDRYSASSRLFLILCGSSMSFMEEQVLGYKSPLYGRRTAQFKIMPFDFAESKSCFSRFSNEDALQIYGIVGGTPQYLLQMDDRMSVADNIKEKLLDPNAYLFEEPRNLLKQEVQKAALYNAVVSAVAGGATKLTEIAAKTGETSSACTACLAKLMALGIVKRETPFGEKQSKKSLYVVSDNLFRFWYRFVPQNLSLVENGMIDVAYRPIEAGLSTYMGAVFEEVCKQYLWELNKKDRAALPFTALGRWWGTDPRTRSQTEIDIMATDDDGNTIFCECKWTTGQVDLSVLELLVYRSELFECKNKHFYIFSRSGFTDGCKDRAKELDKVSLVSFSDMVTPID